MRLFRSADLRNCASGASLLPDVCALAFLLVWILQLYWTSSVAQWVDYNAAVHLDLRNIWQVGESIALAAWCIVFFIRPKAPGFAVAAVSASLVFLGSLAPVVPFPPEAVSAVRIAGSFLSGVGCSTLMLCLCIRLSWGTRRSMLLCLAIALAAASLVDLLFYCLPREIDSLVVPFLPLLVLGCLAFSRNADCECMPRPAKNAVADGFGVSDAAEAADATERSEVAQVASAALPQLGGRRTKMAAAYVLLSLAVGLVYGMSQSFSVALGASGYDDLAYILSIALTAPPIAAAAAFIDRINTAKVLAAISGVVLVSLAFGMLVMAPELGAAAMAGCVIGYTTVYFMIWALWGELANLRQRLIASAAGILALTISVPMGAELAQFIYAQFALSPWVLSCIAMVAVYALIMAVIVLLRCIPGRKAETRTAAEPSQAIIGADDESDGREAALAVHYGLTAREAEVFHLLAQGFNRPAIARELVISDNTVRTHMKSIYRKLDIHTQQELIGLVGGSDVH